MQDGQRNGDYGNADSPASSENRQVEGNPGNGSPFGRILNGIPSTPNKQVRGGGGIRDCFPTTISKIIAVVCVFCVIGASGSAADRADESERLLTDCATVIESKVNSMDSQLKEKDKQIAAAKEETQKAKKELEETKKSLDEANAKGRGGHRQKHVQAYRLIRGRGSRSQARRMRKLARYRPQHGEMGCSQIPRTRYESTREADTRIPIGRIGNI